VLVEEVHHGCIRRKSVGIVFTDFEIFCVLIFWKIKSKNLYMWHDLKCDFHPTAEIKSKAGCLSLPKVV
jgi:hypothetical protein